MLGIAITKSNRRTVPHKPILLILSNFITSFPVQNNGNKDDAKTLITPQRANSLT